MSFSLHEILTAVRRGELRVTAESAGFLALAAAERLRAEPGGFEAARVSLEPAGSIVVDSRPEANLERAETALRIWLGNLLLHASSESAALEGVAEAECQGIESLCRELTGALTPLNRGAAKRALVRLHRRLSELPDGALDAELSESGTQEPSALPRSTPEVRVFEPADPTTASDRGQTPIFGSLQVESRANSAYMDRTPRVSDAALPAGNGAAEYVPAWTPKPPVGSLQQEPSVVIEDGASVVAASERSATIFDRFAPRRSDVDALLNEFGVGGPRSPREASAQLQQSIGLDANFLTPLGPSTQSRTPPPVDMEAEPADHEPRRSKLLWAAGACAVLAFGWWIRSEQQPGTAAAALCTADIEVRAAAHSEVRFVSASQKQRQAGPTATFTNVSCEEDAEVIVLLEAEASSEGVSDADPTDTSGDAADVGAAPQAEGNGGWLRVPVPAQRLRSAADSGEPLVISVFGR